MSSSTTEVESTELQTIIDSLVDVVGRLEGFGSSLRILESRISTPDKSTGIVGEGGPPTDSSYSSQLHTILGRLRAVDEEQTGTLSSIQRFL